jgi:hypothetical protein
MHSGTWSQPGISWILGSLALSEILFTAYNNGQHKEHKEPTACLCMQKPEIPEDLNFSDMAA